MHDQPKCLQKTVLLLEEGLYCPTAFVTGPHCSIGVSACFCDHSHHCPCPSVEENLAVLGFIFCFSPPCCEKLYIQGVGLFCGMGTVTTSQVLSFTLKAQVGTGA